MNYIHKIIKRVINVKSNILYNKSKRRSEHFNKEGSIEFIKASYGSRTEIYNYYHHYFWNFAPKWMREHRAYFKRDFRGFGEDAFHSMWYHIFKEYRPKKVLEIGIYRGQVISLWSLLSEMLNTNTNITGIGPFSPAGDDVSVYLKNIDYYKDVVKNCSVFSKQIPDLNKGYSTDLKMIELIKSQSWDLIYIDGNHDYEIVKQDFEVCSGSLNTGGLIVLDDSSLNTDFVPPAYATAGHPGPSKIADEIDRNDFTEIFSVGHNRVFRKINSI